jgi:predicted dinucleotide-binding enzyme
MMTKEQRLAAGLVIAKKYVGASVVAEIEEIAEQLRGEPLVTKGLAEDPADDADVVVLAVVVWLFRSVAKAATRRW